MLACLPASWSETSAQMDLGLNSPHHFLRLLGIAIWLLNVEVVVGDPTDGRMLLRTMALGHLAGVVVHQLLRQLLGILRQQQLSHPVIVCAVYRHLLVVLRRLLAVREIDYLVLVQIMQRFFALLAHVWIHITLKNKTQITLGSTGKEKKITGLQTHHEE